MNKDTCGKNNEFVWSRTATIHLIELYENHPCLYRTTSADYKNKNKRSEAFRVTAEQLTAEQLNAKMLVNLTAKDIQHKIHGLRTQYLGECQKIRKSKVSGASPNDIYVPKWFYFSLLNFIDAQGMGESNLTFNRVEPSGNQSEDCIQSTSEQFEVIYDGDVEIENVAANSPGFQSPVMISEEESEAQTPLRADRSRVLKRKKLSSTVQSGATNVIEQATKVLEKINIPQNVPITSTHMHFAQMLALEMTNMEPHEDIIDHLKGQIMGLMLEAKEVIRGRKNK